MKQFLSILLFVATLCCICSCGVTPDPVTLPAARTIMHSAELKPDEEWISFDSDTDGVPTTYWGCKTINGHQYIIAYDNSAGSISVVHDPDCPKEKGH